MQYVNNDIDELMRRAAEHNPVQPKGADWNAVLQRLKEGDKPAEEKTTQNNIKRYFLLIPFLLASLICNKFYKVYYPFGTSADVALQKSIKENEKVPFQPLKANNSFEQTTNMVAYPVKTGERQQRVFKNLEKTSRAIHENNTKKQYPATTQAISEQLFAPPYKSQPLTYEKNIPNVDDDRLEQIAVTGDKKIEASTEALSEAVNKNSTIRISRPKSLYASLLAGPDITTIKLQKIKGTGYSVGLLLGYKFRKAWAVEAGALWDRKKYFSEGVYFKTDKIYLPSHSEILEVEGYCDMVEIPINIRYNFKNGRKGDLFAVGGVSSYLMQKEDYDYQYKRYNTLYSSSKYYTQASKEWFSVLNLGVGYERAVGRAGKLRVEPYVKLPLGGMGVGDMPLTSTGIYVGFTRPIR